MSQLLLELFSEEIPARMQHRAAEQLKGELASRLQAENITCQTMQAYVTPRRLTLLVEGLPQCIEGGDVEKRGPRVGAPDNAIEGFLRAARIGREQLQVKETDKGAFYFAVVSEENKQVGDWLVTQLQDIITRFSWPKSMRWNQHADFRWVRPLHSILCLFDGKILPLQVAHITAGDTTYGHRFLAPAAVQVKDGEDYQEKLRKAFVILDREERKRMIKEGVAQHAKALGCAVKEDEALLEEVTGLVEWPVVLAGKIDKAFMGLPKEVLSTVMRVHQRYFSLLNKDDSLAPYFIIVSNMETEDKGAVIIKGNERVLKARLEDAVFFWEQDIKNGMGHAQSGLEKIIFHARLGNMAEKTERIKILAACLATYISPTGKMEIEKAALLCKADLATLMVGEFPELQGIMGGYYAKEMGEGQETVAAIKEHYSPQGPDDRCPLSPVAVTVALADKIDTLAGFFAIGEKPTGSGDPYALRRAALGVIRLIIENKLKLPLREVLERALSKYPDSLFKEKEEKRPSLLEKKACMRKRNQPVVQELLAFMADRLKIALKEQGIRHDVILAVFDEGQEDDLLRLVNRARALDRFLASEDGMQVLAAYRRATNIVVAEEKKDKTTYKGKPKEELLTQEEEKILWGQVKELTPKIAHWSQQEDYEAAVKELAKLRHPVDKFFDNVTVNCDNAPTRKNRLYVLSQFSGMVDQVANFSKIEIGQKGEKAKAA